MTEWTDWQGAYDVGWGELIVGEAYVHPAKFRAGLIDRIYKHGFERGWWVKGDCVGDPFGGIGGGAVYAAYQGLRWVGVELEPKFVKLFEMNVKLHSRRWENGGDPIPVMIQGDSRKFAELVSCSSVVTSPPFAGSVSGMGVVGDKRPDGRAFGQGRSCDGSSHGNSPGQIGNLKAGKLDGVITSPPYADSVKGDHGETETAKESRDKRETPGGSLGQSQRHGGYGSTEGNIGNLKAVVTSPPYAQDVVHARPSKMTEGIFDGRQADTGLGAYGKTSGQIGNDKSEDYWQAMDQVYCQCFDAIRPGGVLVVVIKDYVKAGKRVPLCDQTLALLESIGFVLVERIRAWVTKTTVHDGLFGKVTETVERKSFFRRLAEKKGSPPIDWEEVICVRTPEASR